MMIAVVRCRCRLPLLCKNICVRNNNRSCFLNFFFVRASLLTYIFFVRVVFVYFIFRENCRYLMMMMTNVGRRQQQRGLSVNCNYNCRSMIARCRY